MTSTKMNMTAKTTIAAAAGIALAALIAGAPAIAEAHPLDNVSTDTHVPVAVQGSRSTSTDSAALDTGMAKVVGHACDVASTHGEGLLDAQAEMVRQAVLESAASSTAAAKVRAQAGSESAPAEAVSAEASYAPAAVASEAAPAASVSANTSATPAASEAPAPAPAPAAPAPSTINVDGSVLSYVDTYLASSAPASGAGLWMGSDSTTDGSWGYFIGHNPGPFHHVMDLTGGEAVTVTDRYGNTRTYHVIDVFTITNTTYWEEIESRVTGYGESVVLQTCVGDNAHYRVVVAV